jgi:hypothetical protein
MIKLDQPMASVSALELSNFKFPSKVFNIASVNEFKYIIKDKPNNIKCFELIEGEYSLLDILDALKDGVQELSDDASLQFNYQDGYFYIENKLNNITIINDKSSILNMLGFTKNIYENKSLYKSDESLYNHTYNKIYLYIDTLSDTEPICELDLLIMPQIINKRLPKSVSNIGELIIKFKKSVTQEDDLFNFNNLHHNFSIKLLS